MLVFSRKLKEELVVEEIDNRARKLKVTVLEINDLSVNLGVELYIEDPRQVDHNDPRIRALATKLWRYRNRQRNSAALSGVPENVAQKLT